MTEHAITQGDVLSALARHVGRDNGVHIGALVTQITGAPSTRGDERRVRKVIETLREDEGSHICGKPRTGYFLAATAAELDETCKFLLKRGISTMRKVYRMRDVAMPDFRGQLKLPT